MSFSMAFSDAVLLSKVGDFDNTKTIARLTPGDGRYMAVESRFKTAVLAIFTVFGSGSTEKAVGFSASGLGNFKSTRLGPQPTQEHGVGGA